MNASRPSDIYDIMDMLKQVEEDYKTTGDM